MWDMDELTVEELHKFDDLPARQRQIAEAKAAKAAAANQNGASEVDGEKHLFGKDGFTFDDFLDIINPLQHIPVVSTLYRELTGDQIAMMPRIIGGTLFGGPIGAGAAIVNAAISQETGKDLGEHIVGLFGGDDTTAVADKTGKSELQNIVWKQDRPTIASESISPPMGTITIAKPSQAELDILQSEFIRKQSAQISSVSNPPMQKDIQVASLATPGIPATPTAAEEQILALEKAVERFQQINNAPQNAERTADARNAPLDFKPKVKQAAGATRAHEASQEASPWFTFNQPDSKTAALPGAKPPLGAVALKGGWFSDVMVSALTKYEQSKQLKQPAPAPTVNKLN